MKRLAIVKTTDDGPETVPIEPDLVNRLVKNIIKRSQQEEMVTDQPRPSFDLPIRDNFAKNQGTTSSSQRQDT